MKAKLSAYNLFIVCKAIAYKLRPIKGIVNES